jgi:hypothetical protein
MDNGLAGMSSMSFKRKAAVMGLFVLIIVTYGFAAAGYFSPGYSNKLSNSAKSTLNDFSNNTTLTPTPSHAPSSTVAPTPTRIPVPVDFTVNGSSRAVLTVNVDLNDGINR